MSNENKILDSGNQSLAVTDFLNPNQSRNTLYGLPLGTSDGTATGELATKVIIVGAAAVISPTNLATSAKQDTQITAEQAILAALGGTLTIIATGIQRTPGLQIETDSTHSPITAGKQSVIFAFSTDFAGTVLTKTIDPSISPVLGWSANPGDTLAAIAFTVTAGSVTIATLT